METAQKSSTESLLRNALISVVTDSRVSLDLVAEAALLISLDARFNIWVVDLGKKQATPDELLGAIEEYDDITNACASAWSDFANGRSSEEALRRAIAQSSRILEKRVAP